MKNLVTADWLIKNINRENMIILDCRFELGGSDFGEKAYNESHIEGAYFIDLEKDLSGEKKEHGGRHPLPSIDHFKRKLESCGINDDTTVVIYDDGDLSSASRLWWMMKYIGKEDVFVLEGGFENWVKHGFYTSKKTPEISSPGKLTIQLKPELLCDVDYVRSSLGNNGIAIVDSRAEERYRGMVEPIDKKAGHIPGALNYFWQDNFEGFRIKDMEKLEKRFERLRDYRQIIVHCGSGITACPNILAMNEIGLQPLLYLGGWSDWVSYDENEVITEE